jgi:hypothetical protein
MNESFDPDFAGITDYARLYRSLGLQAVPAMPPTPGEQWKRPAIKWRDYETVLADQATFDQWFGRYRSGNIGYLTGECSGRVFTCDYDTQKGPEADQWWQGLLAVHNNGMDIETPTLRTGGGGIQRIFRYPPHWRPPTCKFMAIHVDIRGVGGFAVLPPSLHESGMHYAWLPGLAPWEVEIADAPQWLMDAIDALVAQYGGRAPQIATDGQVSPIRTQTPQAQRTLSGRLLDGREAYMAALVWRAVCDLRDESPILSNLDGERDAAYQRYEDHVATRLDHSQRHNMTEAQALEAEGRGKSLFDQKWASAIAQWDGKVKEAVAARETAPEPFQVEYMDPETGEFIQAPQTFQDVTPCEQAPTPASAISEPITNVWDPWERFPVSRFPLDTLPAKVRAYVEVSARSTGGDVSACAMSALAVAGAAIDQSFRLKMRKGGTWEVPPLIWVMLFGDPSTKKTPILKSFLWALDKVEAKARQQHQREVARWKADGGKKGDENEPEKPTRYITSDATVEKIADILTRQDRGILLHKDELSGWLAALDGSKNGREAEKSFWTKAYNGNSHSIDRVLRGETFVSNLAVPVIGGMQPDEMAKIPDLTSNGLMQRFMPVVLRPAVKGQDVEDQQEAQDWETLIAYLSSLEPHMMLSSPSAMQVSDQFQDQCAAMERVAALGSKFTTFVGKLPGMHGALSLILHLIDGLWDEPVTGGAAARAERILSQFTIPHAMAFYGVSGDAGDVEQMRSIASYVLASDKDRFTPNDFAANSRSMRGIGMWELAKRLSPLVVNGWLEEEAAKGGGSIKAWVMRPGIREALAARRAEQQAQRRQVAAMLAELRRSASEA